MDVERILRSLRLPRGTSPVAVLAPILVWLAVFPARGLETDPFLVLDVRLDDSAGAANEYVNTVIRQRLDRLRAGSSKLTCEEVVPIIFNGFRQTPRPRITRWVLNDASLDRFPDSDVGRVSYYRQSVLGMPFYGAFGVPLGRIINIGGVYFSADKLGHFFSFGLRYQRRFLRARGHGMSDAEALRVVVGWGFRSELGVVGGTSTGIISFADLEANYQGFRFARSLCDPDSPAHLIRDGDLKWSISGPVDLRDYVNAAWDEAFNPNIYVKRRWKNIRERMLAHCGKLHSSPATERFRGYRETYRPSTSAGIVDELVVLRGLPRRETFSLGSVCGVDRRPTAGELPSTSEAENHAHADLALE